MGGSTSTSTTVARRSNTRVQIKRRHVDVCEEFWQKANVTWTHRTAKNLKLLPSVSEATNYITATASTWHIDDKPGGPEFVKTLILNAQSSGPSSSEYIDAVYKIGGRDGVATYIYVVMGNQSGEILVAFSYHHLTESLKDDSTYTSSAEEITIDWLKWKACQNLQGMLSQDLAPEIDWK